MPRADEDVAEETAVRVLVVDAQLVGRQHRDDGLDDAVSAAILNQAVPHGHDAVRPHGVDAADGSARLVHSQHGMNLVAVVERVVHAQNRADFADSVQQFRHALLLPLQLLRVGQAGQLASAAFRRDGTVPADFARRTLRFRLLLRRIRTRFLHSAGGQVLRSAEIAHRVCTPSFSVGSLHYNTSLPAASSLVFPSFHFRATMLQ